MAKKKNVIELREDMFGVEIEFLADSLDVSKQTVKRWFKGHIQKYRRWYVVDLDTVVDHLVSYQGGKYMERLAYPYTEEDFDNEDNMCEIVQAMLDKFVFTLKPEKEPYKDTGDIDDNFYNHMYTLNMIII